MKHGKSPSTREYPTVLVCHEEGEEYLFAVMTLRILNLVKFSENAFTKHLQTPFIIRINQVI